MIKADFKTYNEGGVAIGLGQCEVPFFTDLDEYKEKYLKALKDLAKAEALSWAMLMVTDVMKGDSILLTSPSKYEKKLTYTQLSDHVYDMPDVLSRKKQLLPEILHAVS